MQFRLEVVFDCYTDNCYASSGTLKLHLKRYVTKHDGNTSVMRLELSNNVNFFRQLFV